MSQPSKSTLWNPLPPETGSKVTRQRSRFWLAAAHSAKDRKLGKGTRWLFSSPKKWQKEPCNRPTKKKNGSFRKRVCLLLSYYFYRATQAGLILTHQPWGSQPSSQAPQAWGQQRPWKAGLHSPPPEVSGELGACCLDSPLSTFQTLFCCHQLYRIIKTSFDF